MFGQTLTVCYMGLFDLLIGERKISLKQFPTYVGFPCQCGFSRGCYTYTGSDVHVRIRACACNMYLIYLRRTNLFRRKTSV